MAMVTAVGTVNNDIFANTGESDNFNGLEGYDVVSRYGSPLKAGAFAAVSPGVFSYTAGAEADIYASIEQVDFIDGRMVFSQEEEIAQVYRLYDAAFNRMPEQAGLNFHTAALYRGTALTQVAGDFATSAEFIQRYGANLSDQGFVEQLYRNVLSREGDAAGVQAWTGALASGTSRADVLVGFSESAEHKAIIAPEIAGGLWDRSENAALVGRLYDAVFDRVPDLGGLTVWTDQLDRGILSANDVGTSFLASAEAQLRYGNNLSNAQLVDALYVNTLGRQGDAAGVQGWVSALDTGTLTRPQVLLGFSESDEHQLQTAATLGGETPATYGITFT
jgi:TorA maturation chaperone TorD